MIKTTIITYYPCRFWGQEFGSSLIGGLGSGSLMKSNEHVRAAVSESLPAGVED